MAKERMGSTASKKTSKQVKVKKKRTGRRRFPAQESMLDSFGNFIRLQARNPSTAPEGMLKNSPFNLAQKHELASQIGQVQGNSHLLRMIESEGGPKAVQRNRFSIQRGGEGVGVKENASIAKGPEENQLLVGDVRLYRLWEYKLGIFNVPGINLAAQKIIRLMSDGSVQSMQLRDELKSLQTIEEDTGPSDLAAIEKAGPGLAKRARGEKGNYLQDATENYINFNRELSEKVEGVKIAQGDLASASLRVSEVILEGGALKAEREQAVAEGEKKAVEEEIKRAKEISKGLLGPVSDLLQGKWKDAGINLAKYLGEELLNAGIDADYDPKLKAAQAKLTNAKARLEAFQDKLQAKTLELAANELQTAKDAANLAQTKLINHIYKIQQAQTTLAEALENMGNPEAAKALDRRETTREASARTLLLIIDYGNTVEQLKEKSHLLSVSYANLKDLLTSPGGEMFVKNEEHRFDMITACDKNFEMLSGIEVWAKSEIPSISNVRGYVTGGSYMNAYNQIDLALQKGLIGRRK